MEKLNFEVSKAIEGKFKVVNTTLPGLESRIGFIDFRKITLDQAEQLVKAGTRYLVKIDEAPNIDIIEVPKADVIEVPKSIRNRREK